MLALIEFHQCQPILANILGSISIQRYPHQDIDAGIAVQIAIIKE